MSLYRVRPLLLWYNGLIVRSKPDKSPAMNPKSLLDKHAILPKKSLGQNFLHDPNALEKIVSVAELMPQDIVLEIGPGTGALTQHLAAAARQVFAVEIDERMRPILEAQLIRCPNVTLLFQDILEVDVSKVVGSVPYMVVANVPYYITSAILRHLLEAPHAPQRIVMTVQEEVAERVVAKPGDMSLLAVSVQYYAKPQIAARFNAAVFWPRPDVGSAVLRLDVYEKPIVDAPGDDIFFRVVRAGFSQKRKQLRNAVGDGLAIPASLAASLLESAGVDPRRRAETLTLEEWAALARSYHAHQTAGKPPIHDL